MNFYLPPKIKWFRPRVEANKSWVRGVWRKRWLKFLWLNFLNDSVFNKTMYVWILVILIAAGSSTTID